MGFRRIYYTGYVSDECQGKYDPEIVGSFMAYDSTFVVPEKYKEDLCNCGAVQKVRQERESGRTAPTATVMSMEPSLF